MDQEIAIRLASTAVPDVSVEQARLIVSEFLTQLAVCAMCDGRGKFTAGHGFTYPVPEQNRTIQGGRDGITISEGSVWPCPQCGSRDRALAAGKDPRFIGWHCLDGYKEGDCRNMKAEPGDRHPECGYRVMLPVDLFQPEPES